MRDTKVCSDGCNREDFVFTRPPGVERFVLSPDNVWYCRLKLLFSMTVIIDGCRYRVRLRLLLLRNQAQRLEPSGM